MGNFSKERVQKHLQNLAIQIKVLQEFRQQKIEIFEDTKNTYAVYHAFLLAIQNVMDIGGHILASLYKKSYSEYEEIAPLLEKHKIISSAMAKQMKGMAGFRNKLVHDYIEIDPKTVYKYLQTETDLFVKYAQVIIKFINKIK